MMLLLENKAPHTGRFFHCFNLKKRDESKIYDILYDKSDKTSDFIKIFCFVVSL